MLYQLSKGLRLESERCFDDECCLSTTQIRFSTLVHKFESKLFSQEFLGINFRRTLYRICFEYIYSLGFALYAHIWYMVWVRGFRTNTYFLSHERMWSSPFRAWVLRAHSLGREGSDFAVAFTFHCPRFYRCSPFRLVRWVLVPWAAWLVAQHYPREVQYAASVN